MPLDKMTKLSWIYDLYRLGQGGSLLNDSQQIYQQILTHIVAGFDAKSGSLALCNEDGSRLTIVAGIDLPVGVVGKTVPTGEGVLGWVVKEQTALLLSKSVASDPRFIQYAQRKETATPNSSMCWPLRTENKVIGAISVNRPSEQMEFVREELDQGTMLLNLVSLALSNIQLQIDQQRRIAELKNINEKLEEMQVQLLQSEKMASIGQLAAGVAHEINNPIGFVYSNLGTLNKYLNDLFTMLDAYEKMASDRTDHPDAQAIQKLRKSLDLGFLREDAPVLMEESRDGITRVKNIVNNLKDFSHVDVSDEWRPANIHHGLDTTLNIVANEIKYKADVRKEYGNLPEVECLPSQLNQVFLNMMVNAAHAIPDRGIITLRTGVDGAQAWVEIEDTGAGIKPENIKRIFDPFFTTKPVGKGTGLGLSLSYSIIQKHHGKIEVRSELGRGTVFKILLPLKQARAEVA